jgi:hypothetical protein
VPYQRLVQTRVVRGAPPMMPSHRPSAEERMTWDNDSITSQNMAETSCRHRSKTCCMQPSQANLEGGQRHEARAQDDADSLQARLAHREPRVRVLGPTLARLPVMLCRQSREPQAECNRLNVTSCATTHVRIAESRAWVMTKTRLMSATAITACETRSTKESARLACSMLLFLVWPCCIPDRHDNVCKR